MKMRFYYIIIIIFSITIYSLFAEEKIDSSSIEADYHIPDSLLSVPLTSHGKIFNNNNQFFRKINKWDIQLQNYITTNDIISKFTPFYNQHLGGYSTYNSFSAFGASSKTISFAYNGRSVYDLELGSFNPELFPTELFENIEIFVGLSAVVLGDNSASVLINYQEKKHNTGKPFTKLWFGNSGYSYLGADGIFSQNIAPNFNFTFGFRSYNSSAWFEDSWGNNWNARLVLRWNPDNLTSISLSENFNNMGASTSGGIEIKNINNIFDRISAVPKFQGLDERVFRHDITLSATRKLDSSGNNSIALNLYFSNSDWDRSSGRNIKFDDKDTNRRVYNYSNHYLGIDGRYDFSPIDEISLKIGGIAELDYLDKTFLHTNFNGLSSAVYGLATMKISDIMLLSGGARIFSKYGNYGLSYGAKQITYFSQKMNLMLDLSYSDRLPFPVEGLKLNSEQHILFLGELNYKFEDSTKLIFGGYLRSIFSPILANTVNNYTYGNFLEYFNGNNINRLGAYLEYSQKILGDYTIILKGLFQLGIDNEGNVKKDYPLFNANLRFFYTYAIGKSQISFGLESGFLTSFTGNNFYPIHRTFYAGDYESGFMTTGLNTFAEIKLGNAFVKISLNNVLNNHYYYVALNPMFERNFRLSANWSFLE